MPTSPTVEITYCRLCGWGLRAGWMTQELLTTFAEEAGSVTLTPDATGGVFEVRVEGELILVAQGQAALSGNHRLLARACRPQALRADLDRVSGCSGVALPPAKRVKNRAYNSLSSISAILSRCRSNPIFSGLLP